VTWGTTWGMSEDARTDKYFFNLPNIVRFYLAVYTVAILIEYFLSRFAKNQLELVKIWTVMTI